MNEQLSPAPPAMQVPKRCHGAIVIDSDEEEEAEEPAAQKMRLEERSEPQLLSPKPRYPAPVSPYLLPRRIVTHSHCQSPEQLEQQAVNEHPAETTVHRFENAHAGPSTGAQQAEVYNDSSTYVDVKNGPRTYHELLAKIVETGHRFEALGKTLKSVRESLDMD